MGAEPIVGQLPEAYPQEACPDCGEEEAERRHRAEGQGGLRNEEADLRGSRDNDSI